MTNNEEKYNKERLEKVLGDSLYDVDQWCEELIMMDSSTTLELQHNRPHELLLTPKTRWFNLSLEQANALVHHYQQHVLKHANKMTNSDEMEIQKLEEQIRNVWNQEKRFLGKKVFCRLSTRSPKDAALFDGSECYRRCKILLKKKWIASYLKFKERKGQLTSTQISRDYILNTETEDFENYVTNVMSHSEEYLSFMQCSQQALAVENERQVIDVLTNSERVLQDLARALEFPEVFNMKLILREWYPDITYEYEFRGFVHNFELIALCQYDNTSLVQELIDKKDEIASSILRYYNTTVKPVLLCKSKQSTSVISKWNGEVIMDFAILQPSKKIIIIECNPFNNGTGASLFEVDRNDMKERYDKTRQFEFRVVTQKWYNECSEQAKYLWDSLFANSRKEIIEEIILEAQAPPQGSFWFSCELL
ncbi:hypothetical protein FDP41_008527 [Naegleria fowleri]|uniref:Cell division cycle protein 123 homolog n=1 Tax=Naegleria fowleri TaxID=5763 RepID=A0A6A5BH46_NAEFO|nr:uncharacterized protein FDP41_008527 [Naegleria fowleri]KAF0973320.1 hypothetical protein FDP41_008527 [Naegleria fowleri]